MASHRTPLLPRVSQVPLEGSYEAVVKAVEALQPQLEPPRPATRVAEGVVSRTAVVRKEARMLSPSEADRLGAAFAKMCENDVDAATGQPIAGS